MPQEPVVIMNNTTTLLSKAIGTSETEILNNSKLGWDFSGDNATKEYSFDENLFPLDGSGHPMHLNSMLDGNMIAATPLTYMDQANQ